MEASFCTCEGVVVVVDCHHDVDYNVVASALVDPTFDDVDSCFETACVVLDDVAVYAYEMVMVNVPSIFAYVAYLD